MRRVKSVRSSHLEKLSPGHFFKSCFSLVCVFFISCFAYGQQISAIHGTITDTAHKPLVGVSVLVKGSQSGTTSDENGQYNLKARKGDLLVFSYLGHISKQVKVADDPEINVVLNLSDADQSLSEVVVVSYGTQRKKDITGAIQTVDFDSYKDLPVNQITQKLQGQLAGVQIDQNTGQPGRGMNIKIRGQMSVAAGSQPLYVVDGFPISGDISFLSPDEVESISVLKDAASTSLYGSRAANGVILVTTKSASGKNGTKISLNSNVGFQEVPIYSRLKMMNAEEFAQFKKEYYEDEGQPVPDFFADPSKFKSMNNNDWYDAMLQKGLMQNIDLSLTNKSDKASTSVIAGVLRQNGVVINTKYNRYNLRINTDYKISDKVSIGANFAPSYIFNNQPQSDGDRGTGLLFDALHTWPVMPIRDADGELTLVNNLPASTGNIFQYPNWVRASKEIIDETKFINLLGNAYIQYQPIKGLVLKSSFNGQYKNTNYFRFNPSTATYSINVSIPTTASSFRSNMDELTLLNENLATYKNEFGKSKIEILGGFTWQKYQEKNFQVQANTYADDRINTIQSAQNIIRSGTNNGRNEWTLASFLGRVNYNFDEKYLVSASIRTDGSSRFGSKNLWGTFPAVSLGWIASQEKFFMDALPWASFFKLRTSYGVVGNNNIGNYTHYALVDNTVNAVFNDQVAAGAALTSLANNRLGWEKTNEFDLGFDLGILNDRIQLSYDYYLKHTTNLLYNVQIPQEAGFTNFNDNIGKIKFWGHEFIVTSRNTVGTFKWTTSANISFDRNIVQSLAQGIDRIYGGTFNVTMVGHPFGMFYGLKKLGLYQNQQDLDKSPIIPGRSTIGSIKLADLNGDGVITYGGDNDDRTIIGNPFPKFVYGITNSINFKNFDFQVICSGSYGNELYLRQLYSLANLDGVFNMVERAKDRWRSESNPGKGFFGTTVGGGNVTGVERDWPHSGWVANASYFTIRNVTLGYKVPIKSNTIEYFRVYGSVQQLYSFTKYWGGGNPETSSSGGDLSRGLDLASYPIPRTFTFGVNLNF